MRFTLRDLSQIRLSHLALQTSEQVNNIYNNFEKDVTNVIDKHIHIKHKYMKKYTVALYEQGFTQGYLQ